MNGLKKTAVILADSMEEHVLTPDSYKSAPESKVNILELGRMTAEEILQFKVG